MNLKTRSPYVDIHIAVFLFGFTAILGKLISLYEMPLVWWRLFFTCLSLLFVPAVIRGVKSMSKRTLLQLAGIGVIVALHWVTFFGAIKLSNVSVALSCFATVGFFTAFIEPLVHKTKVKWYQVGIGLLIVPGMYMIFRFAEFYWQGIIVGLISALLAALFSSLNAKMVMKAEPLPITFVELGSGMLFLSLLMPLYLYRFPESTFLPIEKMDWPYLIILALLCTTLAYVLVLGALKS